MSLLFSSSNYIIFKPRTKLEHYFFPLHCKCLTLNLFQTIQLQIQSAVILSHNMTVYTEKDTLLKQVGVVTRCTACSCDAFVAARDGPQTGSSVFCHAPPAVPRSLLLLHFSFDLCYIMVIFPMSHLHDGKCLVRKICIFNCTNTEMLSSHYVCMFLVIQTVKFLFLMYFATSEPPTEQRSVNIPS